MEKEGEREEGIRVRKGEREGVKREWEKGEEEGVGEGRVRRREMEKGGKKKEREI